MMKAIDSLQLQRLIDGECTVTEIQELLKSARENSSHWQAIALALLEERAWQGEVLGLVEDGCLGGSARGVARQFETGMTESIRESAVQSALVAAEKVGGNRGLPFDGDSEYLVPAGRPRFDRHSRQGWYWLTGAAAVILAALIGYRWGQETEPSGSSVAVNSPGFGPAVGEGSPASALPQITPVRHRPDYHLELSPAVGGKLQGTVPLYSLESFDQWDSSDPHSQTPLTAFTFSAQQLRDLHRQGIGVHEKLEFISGDLENGKKFLVPVRTIHFSPGH